MYLVLLLLRNPTGMDVILVSGNQLCGFLVERVKEGGLANDCMNAKYIGAS